MLDHMILKEVIEKSCKPCQRKIINISNVFVKKSIFGITKLMVTIVEALNIAINYSFPAEQVVGVFEQVIEWCGKPKSIRSDNGTEFTAKTFEGFCNKFGIRRNRSQSGKPMQNGNIEKFNRTLLRRRFGREYL